jgi:hypothetical protein
MNHLKWPLNFALLNHGTPARFLAECPRDLVSWTPEVLLVMTDLKTAAELGASQQKRALLFL